MAALLVGVVKNTRSGLFTARPDVTPRLSAPVENTSLMLPSPSVSISVSPEADILKGAETPDFAEVEAAMEAYSPAGSLKEGNVNFFMSLASSVRCQPSRFTEDPEALWSSIQSVSLLFAAFTAETSLIYTPDISVVMAASSGDPNSCVVLGPPGVGLE